MGKKIKLSHVTLIGTFASSDIQYNLTIVFSMLAIQRVLRLKHHLLNSTLYKYRYYQINNYIFYLFSTNLFFYILEITCKNDHFKTKLY